MAEHVHLALCANAEHCVCSYLAQSRICETSEYKIQTSIFEQKRFMLSNVYAKRKSDANRSTYVLWVFTEPITQLAKQSDAGITYRNMNMIIEICERLYDLCNTLLVVTTQFDSKTNGIFSFLLAFRIGVRTIFSLLVNFIKFRSNDKRSRRTVLFWLPTCAVQASQKLYILLDFFNRKVFSTLSNFSMVYFSPDFSFIFLRIMCLSFVFVACWILFENFFFVRNISNHSEFVSRKLHRVIRMHSFLLPNHTRTYLANNEHLRWYESGNCTHDKQGGF